MTKQFVFILVLSCSTYLAPGQQKSIHDILEWPWHISEQLMSGVGDHRSLPRQTVLTLRPDFTWNSTEHIEGVKKGSWREAGKNKIILIFSKSTEAELLLQDDYLRRILTTRIK
jgi:hypothetical protein